MNMPAKPTLSHSDSARQIGSAVSKITTRLSSSSGRSR